MREMYDAKQHTVDTIAKTVGVSRQTVYRYLQDDDTRATPPALPSVRARPRSGKKVAR